MSSDQDGITLPSRLRSIDELEKRLIQLYNEAPLTEVAKELIIIMRMFGTHVSDLQTRIYNRRSDKEPVPMPMPNEQTYCALQLDPIDPLELGYAQAVSWFANQMLQKLIANKVKGSRHDWINHFKPEDALRRLREEIIELSGVILDDLTSPPNRSFADRIILECADVANFALMLADIYRARLEKLQSPPPPCPPRGVESPPADDTF